MPPNIWLLFAQVGPFVLGFLGIYVALTNQRRQLNAQMFIEFSGRFQEILRMFPTQAWLANHNPSQPMPPSSQEITDCTLYSIQFIADAYHLHKNGLISRKIWLLWERQIKRTLSGRVFQREWEKVAMEFSYDPQFLKYVKTLMSSERTPWSAAAASDALADGPAPGSTALR